MKSVIQIYNELYDQILFLERFKYEGMCSSKEEYEKLDSKAKRKATIYAVQNAWYIYNSKIFNRR